MPRTKSQAIAEFGDFQTPPLLATRCCALLKEMGVDAATILEPTCGRGGFLLAAADQWPTAAVVKGIDINPAHVAKAADTVRSRSDNARFSLDCADFFELDLSAVLSDLAEPILVVGNPPWVTNAHVSALGGSNLPTKTNFQRHKGLDALTGKSNFDISEWMLSKLADALNGRDAMLAMLVKNVVARKLLHYCWKRDYSLTRANLFGIDAAAHFDVAVDASLVVMNFGPVIGPRVAHCYDQLSESRQPCRTIGVMAKSMVADLQAYRQTKQLDGGSAIKWRSGIKHDCSRVMELRQEGNQFRNGLGDLVDLEPDYLFPMLKSSEVSKVADRTSTRWMIVPQQRIGQSTAEIVHHAPQTWNYLQHHRDLLSNRASSIYTDKPEFSVFGVGEYSFAPWKVAIAGMYKSLRFGKVGPRHQKPVVFDDTTNFLACPSQEAAELVHSMLATSRVQTFFAAFVFWLHFLRNRR
ncbi:MAG: hypothetical protein K2Y37_17945 [Pirellulales bacterium]|nr:hypothetical protein [Pirellulales bacterium]